MSIRRRNSIGIVDIWVTNNSDSVLVVGSIRWAVAQLVPNGLTVNPVIKWHPDFIDIAGTGRNYTFAGAILAPPAGVSGLTIDFSNIDIIFASSNGVFRGFNGITDSVTNYINAKIENQTIVTSIFGGNILLEHISFQNITMNTSSSLVEPGYNSTIRDCVFKNITKTGGVIISTPTSRDCVFQDNVVDVSDNRNFFLAGIGAKFDIIRNYIVVRYTSGNFICGNSTTGRYNFYNNYIEYVGTSNVTVFGYANAGDVINNTLVNIRLSSSVGFGEQTHKFIHNTQIFTRSLGTTILNNATLSGNEVRNNIIIAPSTNNIFPTTAGLTYVESGNLYLCVNANAKFPNSTHYGASTPLTTLIDTNQQGVGETYQRFYLPTITGNVARLADVTINQIYQNRNNPTNSGSI
jgi:hypothetical protein